MRGSRRLTTEAQRHRGKDVEEMRAGVVRHDARTRFCLCVSVPLWSAPRHREDLESVAAGFEAAFAAEALAEGDEFGGLDLLDLAGIEADEQVIRSAAVDELIVGVVFVKEDALDDAGILEQADGAVDGGLGDARAGAL